MNVPDFSKPSPNCFLTVDSNGTPLKVGDVIYSEMYPLRGGFEPVKEYYNKVEEYEGHLIIRHSISFLLEYFVRGHCTIY